MAEDESLKELQQKLAEQDKPEGGSDGAETSENKKKGEGGGSPKANSESSKSGKRRGTGTEQEGILEALRSGPSEKPSKESITFSLPADLVDRLRNLCYWERLVMSKFVEAALRNAVSEAEEQGNDGKPYPKREDDLPTSRPQR